VDKTIFILPVVSLTILGGDDPSRVLIDFRNGAAIQMSDQATLILQNVTFTSRDGTGEGVHASVDRLCQNLSVNGLVCHGLHVCIGRQFAHEACTGGVSPVSSGQSHIVNSVFRDNNIALDICAQEMKAFMSPIVFFPPQSGSRVQ